MARGEAGAIRDCIEAYGGLVWSLARRLSGGLDVEDAVQEIFLDLWRSASRFDPRVASEMTFVAMIARRRLIDRRRARARRPEGVAPQEPDEGLGNLADGAGSDSATLGTWAETCAEVALAGRALAQLSPEQREVLLLAARNGLSHEEIAAALGMPLGTVKTHARRGLLRVREILLKGNRGDGTGGSA